MPLKQNLLLNNHFNMSISDIDIIIGATNKMDGFHSHIIEQQELVIAYDKYPMESLDLISIDEYYRMPQVSVDFIDKYNTFREYLGHTDSRNIIYRVSSIELLKNILSDKYIVTLTDKLAKVIGLKYIPLPLKTNSLPIYMHTPKSKYNDVKNKWVRSIILETLKEIKEDK